MTDVDVSKFLIFAKKKNETTDVRQLAYTKSAFHI